MINLGLNSTDNMWDTLEEKTWPYQCKKKKIAILDENKCSAIT